MAKKSKDKTRETFALDFNRYRVPGEGKFRLASVASNECQGLDRDWADRRLRRNLKQLRTYQERLFAEGQQSLLIVLQAMDTAGKDSTIRKVMAHLNPQGCQVTGFKAPSDEELAHDFLWRVHDHSPPRGHIGIFNRSHYEDVLIVRVHGLAPPGTIRRRYDHINHFERLLADHGTRIVKFMLHISKDYQRQRLLRRLARPDKLWKFNPGDLEERQRWDDYMNAYEVMLNRCSTDRAPWYVIPAEKRWFRNTLISEILTATLGDMDPRYPPPDFDPRDFPPESIE